jgi:hypothetical protein
MKLKLLCLSFIFSFQLMAQEASPINHEAVQKQIETGKMKEESKATEVEVLATNTQGLPEIAKVINKETGKFEIIGLGANGGEANANLFKYLEPDPDSFRQDFINNRMTFRLVAALRAKFADLIGFRVGFQVGDYLEFGVDAGTSIFVTHRGLYATVYPFGGMNNGWRHLYLSSRFYSSSYFAILAMANTVSGEGVVGYTFDKKPGGIYSFVEAGVNVSAKQYAGDGIVGPTTGTLDKSIILPVVGVGFGWRINMNGKKPRPNSL